MILEWIGYFSYESLFSAFRSTKEGLSVVLLPDVSYVMLIQNKQYAKMAYVSSPSTHCNYMGLDIKIISIVLDSNYVNNFSEVTPTLTYRLPTDMWNKYSFYTHFLELCPFLGHIFGRGAEMGRWQVNGLAFIKCSSNEERKACGLINYDTILSTRMYNFFLNR